MAQVIAWFQSSWIGTMPPGGRHGWIAWGGGLKFADVVNIMAHPVVGNPNAQERVLQVENVRAEGTPDGVRRIFFEVRNAGPESIVGYSMTGMTLRA